MPETPREITAETLRNLEPGRTLSAVEYLPEATTIREAVDNARRLKNNAAHRYNKSVVRARQSTGADLVLTTQMGWNDKQGVYVLVTVTRRG